MSSVAPVSATQHSGFSASGAIQTLINGLPTHRLRLLTCGLPARQGTTPAGWADLREPQIHCASHLAWLRCSPPRRPGNPVPWPTCRFRTVQGRYSNQCVPHLAMPISLHPPAVDGGPTRTPLHSSSAAFARGPALPCIHCNVQALPGSRPAHQIKSWALPELCPQRSSGLCLDDLPVSRVQWDHFPKSDSCTTAQAPRLGCTPEFLHGVWAYPTFRLGASHFELKPASREPSPTFR